MDRGFSMGREQDEQRVYQMVHSALSRWLHWASEAVLAPWRRYKIQPDPAGIYQTQALWNSEVDTILTVLGQIAMGAWAEATDVPPVSRHAFVMSQLAQTRNLLVRIPDEVYNLVFAELVDGVNGGDSLEQLAQRVDAVLSMAGSENWPNRARVIAQTEVTRAYGAGTLAAGMEQSRVTGRMLRKRWDTEKDARVRQSHRGVNGEVVDLSSPFYVGGYPMLYPGDPLAAPEEVVNCRCDLRIVNERGR